MKPRTALMGTCTGRALSDIVGHGAEELTVDQAEARQRAAQGPTRGEKRRMGAAAAVEMQEVAQHTVVLAHIHPRWVRLEVERLLDIGLAVTADDIANIRKGS